MSSSLPASPRVLRIPRSDEPDSHVLVHVSRKDSVDLTLAATEGEHPYVGSVNQSGLKRLRGKNYQGSDDEWAQIVSYALGQLPPSAGAQDYLTGVETGASISGSDEENKEMIITIRQRIQSITQKLGSITLKQNDEQSLELVDWCGSAVARADALESQISSLSSSYRAAENTIQKLNRQLEEFIRARDQDQDRLVAHFADLLNEKKLKIRNQQRLLVAAKVDPSTAPEISEPEATTSPKPRKRKGRPSKRTAREMSNNESDSEDGFENSGAGKSRPEDVPVEAEETDDEQASTPQRLEEEDAATTDEELEPPPVESMQGRSTASSNHPAKKVPSAPPPRRELPFARRTQGESQMQAQPHHAEKDAEDIAGETDDDEL